ncbi:MAG TPA: hypothetical protein VE988_06850, partial [Gemmataceae bacterium]|nr:hypothetical protein [Gemmataceae bacterium]
TTIYLADPALRLVSARMGRNLLFTEVSAGNCVFAAGGAKPLVRLDGPENATQLKMVLGWSGAAASAYFGFDKLLEQAGEGSTPLVYHSDEWKTFAEPGVDSRFGNALDPAAGSDRSFAQLLPGDFTLPQELSAFGAALEPLPRPTVEVKGSSPRH